MGSYIYSWLIKEQAHLSFADAPRLTINIHPSKLILLHTIMDVTMELNQISNFVDATINHSNGERLEILQYPSIVSFESLIGNTTERAIPPRSERRCCQPIRFQRLYCYGCFTVLKLVSYCPHRLRRDDFLSQTICYDCKFNSSWALATDDPSYLKE